MSSQGAALIIHLHFELIAYYMSVLRVDINNFVVVFSASGGDGQPGVNAGFSRAFFKEFAEEQHEKYICCYCLLILRNPQQTDCGHRVCFNCFHLAKETDIEAECKPCRDEDTVSKFSKLSIWPDKAIAKELGRETIRCLNKPCEWTGKFRNYPEHENICEFASLECKYCLNLFRRMELKCHQDAGSGQCAGLKGGDQLTEKEKKDIAHQMVALKKKAESIANKLSCIDEEAVRDLKINIESLEKFLQQNGPDGPSSVSSTKVVKQLKQTGKCDSLESEACGSQINSQEEVFQQQQSMHYEAKKNQKQQEVDRKLATIQQKIFEFEENGGALHRQAEQEGMRIQKLQKSMNDQRKSIEEQEKKVSELEKKSISQDGMARQLKTWQTWQDGASHDGVLIWRLTNIFQRCREAKANNNSIPALYSQPFHTGAPGYKLCARVYLNGDGVGKNTHLSLFFAVMKGNYDAILSWPLHAKVVLQALDQSPRKQHITETFNTDPNNSSCKRPVNDLNTATGCPLFLPQSLLDDRSRGYASEDTLFLKIVVKVLNK